MKVNPEHNHLRETAQLCTTTAMLHYITTAIL